MSHRQRLPEILDDPCVTPATAVRAYRQLHSLECALGVTREILRLVRAHQPRPCRIVDIGCGGGQLLKKLRNRLRISVAGVDLKPLMTAPSDPHVYRRDATLAPIPKCDIALCLFMIHHLADSQAERLIANVGRGASRLIIVDPVRGPVPERLFRMFVAPWLDPVVASDGLVSIANSFTPSELSALATRATQGTGAKITPRISWLTSYQIMDIRYG